jgi:predicted MPP superfamily phosphohydrolase
LRDHSSECAGSAFPGHRSARREGGRRTVERPAGPLEIGLRRALHIREERLSAHADPCRLLYVSDIHLREGRFDTLSRQILGAASTCLPDAILLGGDLVDSATELAHLGDLVAALSSGATVFAVGGNHDRWVGTDRVGQVVERAGGHWIHHGTAYLTRGERIIALSGPDAAAIPAGDVRVMCAHNPRGWKRFSAAGYDLVLAGHLHGCQIVAWEYRDCLVPGVLFYPHCVLRQRHGGTRLVVSRGVSDLLPIRWRCPREVVLCYV